MRSGAEDVAFFSPAPRIGRTCDPLAFIMRTPLAHAAALLASAWIVVAAPAPAGAADGVPYETAIVGAPDDLAGVLEEVSALRAREDDPPATEAGLRRRIEDDLARFAEVLRAEGYHDGRVDVRREGTAPVRVVLEVAPGPRYVFDRYRIRADRPDPPAVDFDPAALGVAPGAPARAADIVAAETAILRRLGRNAFPFAAIARRAVEVDHAARTVTVILDLALGSRARFGPVAVEGLEDVDPAFVRRRVPWAEGDPYDIAKVESFRRALVASALFDSVAIEPSRPARDGAATVTITLVERRHRTVGLGLSYGTDVGAGGRLYWTHRNLFGEGERLSITAEGGQTEKSGELAFRKPDFFGLDQALLAELRLADETTDAFDSLNFGGKVGVERRVNDAVTGSLALGFDHIEVKQSGAKRVFDLASLPGRMSVDTSDDVLDPTEGVRLDLLVTPYAGVDGDGLFFVRNEVVARTYADLDGDGGLVAALRGRFGSIVGADTGDIPATERFYAGGGGSVRGFAFQKVGPLDGAGDPVGGRSVLEVGLELRARITDTIGVVPFVDGGMVYDSSVPDLERDFLWGAGLGLRYYTDIGPVRVDLATPINGRSSDDSFQFYVSLGQAF